MKVSRYKKEDSITYALGATVVMEFLINRPEQVEGVILHPKFDSEDTIRKIEDITKRYSIPVTTEEKAFNILSQKENCFVIGVIRKVKGEIEEGNHVVLVNPSNAGNFGTIVRSCAGFGIKQIAVIPPAVDHFDPKTVRASMGAVSRVNIEVFPSFEDYSRKFPGNNYYPFMLDGSVLLQKTEIKEPCSLIFGNEATGLPEEFSKIGQPVRIEHTDNIDSLNLPIAASIALYEATKGVFG
ncbi:MAG: TrmH family RNA methyltransferase [Clostridiales bacterium]|nr:TrmH family RNA methyltransferase [Clostridiales bacterium]